MIDGLKELQAVELEDGTYLVKLDSRYDKNQYSLTDNPYELFTATSSPMILNSISTIHRLIREPAKTVGYAKEDGEVLTPQEYSAIINKKYEYYDEDLEEYTWSLEEEFEYKKSIQDLGKLEALQSEPTEYLKPIQIEVVGSMISTGSDYIKSALYEGKTAFSSNGSGVFCVNESAAATNEWILLAKEYPDHKFTNDHNKLEFAKLNEKYMFGSRCTLDFIKRHDTKSIHTDLQSAKDREKRVRDTVRKVVMTELSTADLDAVMVKNVISKLSQFRWDLDQLDVKQKAASTRRSIINRMSDMITELEKHI